MPLAGPLGAVGKDVKIGYEIAVEHYNADGGIFVKEYNKRIPVELIILDDESDPTKTVSRLETLNTTHKVVAYLGTAGSGLHAAAAGIAEKNKIAYVGTAFGLVSVHRLGYKYTFSVMSKAYDTTESDFQLLNYYVPEGERPTKVAIFTLNTEDGIEPSESWKEYAPEYGYEVVVERTFSYGTKDFSSLILAAKAAGADMLVSFPAPPEGFTIIKQSKELGWRPKYNAMMRGASIEPWPQIMGPDGDYVASHAILTYEAPYLGMRELNATFKQKYGKPVFGLPPGGYAAVQVVLSAIERAGTLDRQKIRDAIAATDMMTVNGPMKFRSDGTPLMSHTIIQWQDGKGRLIWPPEIAAAPLLYPAPPWK
jgi:branched-chain amino acid transport system substrate-binding protein